MTEEEAVKKINDAIKKGVSLTAKPKSYLLEIEFIFRDELTAFNKLLDKSKQEKGTLYYRYLELLQIRSTAYKYSTTKGLDDSNNERPPITVITFSASDLDDKLKKFQKEIEDYKNG